MASVANKTGMEHVLYRYGQMRFEKYIALNNTTSKYDE